MNAITERDLIEDEFHELNDTPKGEESTHAEEASGGLDQHDVMPSMAVSDTVDFLTDFEAHNAGADVRIYKITEGQRTPSFVTNFPVGTKSYINLLKYLQKRYPDGGDFMVHVRAATGTKPFLARRRLRVEPSKPQNAFEGGEIGMGKLLSDILRQQEDRFNSMMERLERREEETRRLLTAQPQQNPVEMFKAFAEVLKPAMQPQAAPAPAVNPMRELRDSMELYRMIRDEAREEVGESSGDESIGVTLLKNLPKLGEVVTALRGGTPPAAMPALVAPTGMGPQTLPAPGATSPQPKANGADMPNDLSQLSQYFDILNAQAVADNDPDAYAQLIIDHTQPAQLQQLLSRPALQSEIEAAYPAAKPYREWWAELIECVRERLNSDSSGVGDTAGESATH